MFWLDLANAYGSIPQKLVKTTLYRDHIPCKIKDLQDYYENFRLRVTSGSITSNWQWLEKGIITGCMIFVILFALAMNKLVKAPEVSAEAPCSSL